MTRFTFSNAALPAALLLCALTPRANAQVYITTDTTINSSVNGGSVSGGSIVVGYASRNDQINQQNPFSPRIAVVAGADFHDVLLYNQTTLTMTGGQNFSYNLYDNSVVTITGGVVTNQINAGGNSIVNLRGGNVGLAISALQNSTINFYGSGLSDTFIGISNQYSQYTLHGRLSDGTSIEGKTLNYQNLSNARINFFNTVPEPGSLALLVGMGLSGAGFLVRRRK